MNDLFERISKISHGNLSEQQVKEMVVSVIDVMKKHHITYDQAFELLAITRETLQEMAQAVEL